MLARRILYIGAALMIAMGVIGATARPAAAEGGVTVVWDGNGYSGGGVCSSYQLDADLNVNPGEQGWLFILTSPYDDSGSILTVQIGEDIYSVTGVKKGGGGGSYHYPVVTSEGAALISASATNGTDKSNLTLSHCETYPKQLTVTKTAAAVHTRTYRWTIAKSVTPAQWDLFTGDSATSSYLIKVEQIVTDKYTVSGSITIQNPDTHYDAIVTGVTDVIATGLDMTVNCGVTFPYTLAKGGTLTCSYSGSLPDHTDGRVNTATVAAHTGDVDRSASGTALVYFGADVIVGYPTVNIVDGASTWPLSHGDSITYDKTFTCGETKKYDNVAKIDETGQSASASVQVNCYDVGVTKDAATSYTRTFDWTIAKAATPSAFDLFTGDSQQVQYVVTLVKDAGKDSAWAVTGKITLHNPAPMAAVINSVADVVSTDITADVDCHVSFPYTLAAGGDLICDYQAGLPNATQRLNTATATLQNYSYAADGTATAAATTGFSGTADVIFGAPTTLVHDKVHVTDTNGSAWEFNASGSQSYYRTFTCGQDAGSHGNTATITELEKSASASVTVGCYGLQVTKNANALYTRTWKWTVDKAVSDDLNLFRNDSGEALWTVTVFNTGFEDTAPSVIGTIKVYNPAPIAATINSLADLVSPDIAAGVTCPVTFPYSLAAGGTLTCGYSAALPDKADRTNTATATLQNYSYTWQGAATPAGTTGFSGSADVKFGDPTTKVDETVTAADTNGMRWTFTGGLTPVTWSKPYKESFGCSAAEGNWTRSKNNLVTLIGDTGLLGSDQVTLKINCYDLGVKKTAETYYSRTWNWTIDKTGDQSALTLSIGQAFVVNYAVVVNASFVEQEFSVAGTIEVTNPAPIAATISSVADAMGAVAAKVNCGVDFPYTLLAGETLTCGYTAALPDKTARTNQAIAMLRNHNYPYGGDPVATGFTVYLGEAAVTFGQPGDIYDECINVVDDKFGALGVVCAAEVPKTFTYQLTVGPYDTCGSYQYVNIATFTTNDTGKTGSDAWTVNVNIPCGGCTLTPGYWKTHSSYGPARSDPTWDLLPQGPNTNFYLSGQNWYTVLWTSPQGGNAYYILAHAYIAAKLNILDGASSTSKVNSALSGAEGFFNTYGPNSTLSKSERAKAINWASILDQYNNGLIGPGHCSE